MIVATSAPPASRSPRARLVAISAISWSPSRIVAALVGDDQPVGVAVERDADIGAARQHLAAHLLRATARRIRG